MIAHASKPRTPTKVRGWHVLSVSLSQIAQTSQACWPTPLIQHMEAEAGSLQAADRLRLHRETLSKKYTEETENTKLVM